MCILLEEFIFNCVLFEDRRTNLFGLWLNKFVQSFKIIFMPFLKLGAEGWKVSCVFP
jgi:hypothetical protein